MSVNNASFLSTLLLAAMTYMVGALLSLDSFAFLLNAVSQASFATSRFNELADFNELSARLFVAAILLSPVSVFVYWMFDRHSEERWIDKLIRKTNGNLEKHLIHVLLAGALFGLGLFVLPLADNHGQQTRLLVLFLPATFPLAACTFTLSAYVLLIIIFELVWNKNNERK